MNVAQARGMGYYSKELVAFPADVFTAGTSGDEEYIAGTVIDRRDIEGLYLSGKVIVPLTVLGLIGVDDCGVNVKVEDAALEAGPFASYVVGAVETFAADGNYVHSLNVDLGGARRFLRISLQGVFAAAGTDTISLSGVLQVGGIAELPATVVVGDSFS